MKEKLTRNIGLKVLSVILAAILWLVITNVDDPITTGTYRNVPVKIINEDAIKKLDQVYEVIEGEAIDFTWAARRSIADDLSVSDFEVTADLSKLSDVNAVNISITCPRYSGDITITDGLYQVMKIHPEQLQEKNFKVTVVTQGEPAEGYYVGEKTASTIITVSGPKTKIERIKEIVATVNVAEYSVSFNSYVKLKALDAEGEEIDNLSFSENYATININIYETKIINLKVKTTGNPAQGFVVTNVDYEPKTIEVAGKDKALNSINELVIEDDISGANKNIEKEINLQEKLGEGLVLVGEDQTAVVYVTIEKAETKDIVIWPGDIEVRNKPLTLDLSYLTTGPITIQVVGPAGELASLSRNTLKPSIDLIDYGYGTYSLPVNVVVGAHCSIAENPKVSVSLTENNS